MATSGLIPSAKSEVTLEEPPSIEVKKKIFEDQNRMLEVIYVNVTNRKPRKENASKLLPKLDEEFDLNRKSKQELFTSFEYEASLKTLNREMGTEQLEEDDDNKESTDSKDNDNHKESEDCEEIEGINETDNKEKDSEGSGDNREREDNDEECEDNAEESEDNEESVKNEEESEDNEEESEDNEEKSEDNEEESEDNAEESEDNEQEWENNEEESEDNEEESEDNEQEWENNEKESEDNEEESEDNEEMDRRSSEESVKCAFHGQFEDIGEEAENNNVEIENNNEAIEDDEEESGDDEEESGDDEEESVDDNEANKKHLKGIDDHYEAIEDIEEVAPPNAQFTAFHLIDQHDLFKPTLSWKIKDYADLMSGNCPFEYDSMNYYWPSRSVESIVVLEAFANRHVSVFCYVDKRHMNVPMDVKVFPTVYFLLFDQRGTGSHRIRFRNYSFPELFDTDTGYNMPLLTPDFHNDRNSLYLVDNCVVLKTYVEPLWSTLAVHSRDGTLKWTVDEYAKRKRMEEMGLLACQESPYFYTNPSGYRIQARAYLNYQKNGQSWLVLGAQVLTGENDETLAKNFKHCTTFTLTNRADGASVTKVVVSDETLTEYGTKMVLNEDVEQLLVDDSMFCHIKIEPC